MLECRSNIAIFLKKDLTEMANKTARRCFVVKIVKKWINFLKSPFEDGLGAFTDFL